MDKKLNLYIAGALFNEAEISQRKLEAKILSKEFGNNIQVFNPIDQPFNINKASLPTPETIYKNDANAILKSDVIIFDITNDDPGVLVELGLAFMSKKKPIIICVNSDIRLADANKYSIPTYSINHFVLGGILTYGYLVKNFNEAIKKLKQILKQNIKK